MGLCDLDKDNVTLKDLPLELIVFSDKDTKYSRPMIVVWEDEGRHVKTRNVSLLSGLIAKIQQNYIQKGNVVQPAADVIAFKDYLKTQYTWNEIYQHPAFWPNGGGMQYATDVIKYGSTVLNLTGYQSWMSSREAGSISFIADRIQYKADHPDDVQYTGDMQSLTRCCRDCEWHAHYSDTYMQEQIENWNADFFVTLYETTGPVGEAKYIKTDVPIG